MLTLVWWGEPPPYGNPPLIDLRDAEVSSGGLPGAVNRYVFTPYKTEVMRPRPINEAKPMKNLLRADNLKQLGAAQPHSLEVSAR